MLSIHRCTSKCLSFLVVLIVFFTVAKPYIASSDDAAPAGWLAGYRYRVPIAVENTTGEALPASPTLLHFDSMSQILRGKLRRDGGDLRVTDGTGAEVPRYVEGLQDDSEPARIWVRSAPLAAAVKTTYYIYYGNPNAKTPTDAAPRVFAGKAQLAGDAMLSEDFEDLAPDAKPVDGAKTLDPQGVPGYHGRGAWFNGQNAGMMLKAPDPVALTQGFTVAMWMKMLPHTIVSPQALVDIDGVFLIRENEVILSTAQARQTIPFKTPINQWMHIAATYDGTTLRVLVNGQEAGKSEVKGTPEFPRGNVALGFDPTNGFYSPVVFDDFALWGRALKAFPDVHAAPVTTTGAEEINAAVPAPHDPATHPIYIPIEAENFEGIVDSREADKYYQSLDIGGKKQWFVGYDRTYLSRGYGIFTLTEGAAATKTVQIPADGNYKLWVRYAPVGEQESSRGQYTGSEFQVEAAQNGKTIATHEFGATLDYDTRMARWESTPVSLKKGAATLTLTKNTPTNAGEKIDLFVLTNDANYVPDQRHYGMVWLRFKLLDVKGTGPYRAELRTLLHSDPWYKFADLNDREYDLTAGKDTGWINGLDYLKGASDGTLTLSLFDENRKPQEWGKVQLEYARLPQDSSIYKTAVSESTRAFGFSVLGPMGDLEKTDELSDSLEAISRRHLEEANAQNWPQDNIPKTITVSATTSIGQYSDEVVRNELTTLRRMGMNFSTSDYDAWGGKSQTEIATKELGFNQTVFVFYLNNFSSKDRENNSPYGTALWKIIGDDLDARIKALRDRSGEEEIKRIRWAQLNDEVESYLEPRSLLAQPESLAAFKKWLTDQKITPASIGLPSWDALKVVNTRTEAKTPEQKRLWMHEMDFLTYTTTMVYKRTTQMVETGLGHPVDTTINPSPNGFLFHGWAEDGAGLNYLHFWQDGGVTMPWSEDWNFDNGLLYISNEITSYIAELTRCGASQSKATGMYITSGNADSRRQKIYLVLGRGGKHVNHYTYGPRFANTEGSWSHHPEIFDQIGFINADIAHADDLLGPAKPRKSQVAILYPWSSDVWQRNTASIAERFYEYLALVHAQTPVDILSEEQIAGSGLSGYKTLYVMDDNVRRATTQQIAKWVNGGGTLVATMGAGTRDEYDADMTSFNTLLGLDQRTVQITNDGTKFDFHRNGIPQWTKVGEISLSAPLGVGKLAAYAMKATADVKSAKVVGTWADGSPAATLNTSGQGRAIWIGAYPGFAYARGSNLGAPLTTEYPSDVRNIILAPTKLAGVKRDVELSTPVVEATLQDGDKGAVVTLINYTMQPIAEVTMTAHTSRPVKRAVAVQSGKELKCVATADGVQVTLPLGMTEFVKLYY